MLEDARSWRHYREHPETFRFPGGESLADQQRRVLAGLRDAARRACPALLVMHAGSMRVARCFLDGRGLAAFHDMGAGNGGVDEVPAEGLAARIGAFLEESR
jgi:broad specificity phosphatase PhoE